MTTQTLREGWTVRAGERHALGEGPRLVDGRIVMVDILAGRLLDAATGREILRLDVPLGAVAPLRSGRGWIAAAGTGVAVLEDGGLRWLARPEDDAPTPMRMNDGVADPHGRFWAGSMAYDTTAGAGSLYRVDPDGTVHRVLDGLTIPNGPAFDPAGHVLYLADSARGVIHRYAVDPETGELGAGGVWARVEGGSPDGMCVDDEQHVWSAVWGASRLDRYAPDGTRVASYPVPVRQPSAVALTPDGRILVTSAAVGLDDPGPDDGAVLTGAVAVGAAPACAFGAP